MDDICVKRLVIDDRPIVLYGIATLLAGSNPGGDVATARNAQISFKLAEQLPDLDIVRNDLKLRGVSGYAAIAEFGRLRPTAQIIVLSSSGDPVDVLKAIELSALGYVPKSARSRKLMSAIGLVMNVEIYVPALIAGSLSSERPRAESVEPAAPRVTERQIEVLRPLIEVLRPLSYGVANKDIAKRICLSEKTVKIQVSAIFRMLKAINRTLAARVGRKRGLL